MMIIIIIFLLSDSITNKHLHPENQPSLVCSYTKCLSLQKPDHFLYNYTYNYKCMSVWSFTSFTRKLKLNIAACTRSTNSNN